LSVYSCFTRIIGAAPFSFPKEEERILAYWREIDAFRTSVKLSEGRKPYTFYDGPPFATGLPHYGHLLAGTIKVCDRKMIDHYISNKCVYRMWLRVMPIRLDIM
jgi:isoleucyl-tRNA synthetase